jgi:UDP:flavonoid glycosyltransferase YjiC (YdhE family)
MSHPRRFLIATWDGGGNTPPAINLGMRLVRRGHRVRMIGWESLSQRSAEAGVEFTTYRSMSRWPENLSMDDAWDRVDAFLHGDATRGDILAAARDFRPDVLVLDCMMGAGFAAARQLSLPSSVLVHVLYSAFVSGWGDQVMHASVADLLAATERVLALVPPGFDAPVALPANTSYVGPITRPQRDADVQQTADLEMISRPGDPWVLLTLSTTLQRQTEALPRLIEAVESLPVRVLLTLGGVIPTGAVKAPGNVTVRDFVPHDAVLPHMAAVICHAGLSTITAALAAGVPLMCIPQGRDQDMNSGPRGGLASRAGRRARIRRGGDRRRCARRHWRPVGARERSSLRRGGRGARRWRARHRRRRAARRIDDLPVMTERTWIATTGDARLCLRGGEPQAAGGARFSGS